MDLLSQPITQVLPTVRVKRPHEVLSLRPQDLRIQVRGCRVELGEAQLDLRPFEGLERAPVKGFRLQKPYIEVICDVNVNPG